jgi:hypothetical protein
MKKKPLFKPEEIRQAWMSVGKDDIRMIRFRRENLITTNEVISVQVVPSSIWRRILKRLECNKK